MNMKEIADKYLKKLSFEGWLKSIFSGFGVGFIADLIYCAICWFFGFKSIALSLVVLFGIATVATVLFYFLRFKPTDEQVARRLDSMGLEERIITMNELKNDNSFVAQKQREDAKKALSQANASLMKFVVSVPLAIVFGLSVLLSVGVNVFATTSKTPGREIFEQITGETKAEYVINYMVVDIDTGMEGGGYIEGDMFQIVEHGENAEPVTVVADEGYVFLQWDYDKSTSPYRAAELNVTKEGLAPYLQEDGTYLIIAVVQNMEYGEGGDESGDSNSQAPQDPNAPPAPPGEDGNPGENGEGDGKGDGSSQDGIGNKVDDGDTAYGDNYSDYQGEANNRVDKDNNLDDGTKDAIGDYMDSLNPGK